MEYSVDELAICVGNYRRVARCHAKLDAYPAELLEDACEDHGLSEIHKIVWGISYEDLDTKVRACPKAVDGLDIYGRTPLDYAVGFGNSDHVKVLLSHGADIGRQPHYLFWTAVESGNCASTQLLLDRGLRPNDLVPRLPALDLYSPEDKLDRFSWSSFRSFRSFVYYIDSYHNTPAMDRLLIDYGFDFNTEVSHGLTALMACCRWDSLDSSHSRLKRIESLLEYGVDPEIKDQYGRTAIHHALCNENVGAFELLTEYGARLDARTYQGETVLHMAVQRTRRVAIVHALFKAAIMRLDLDAPRHDGRIAFNVLRCRAAKTESSFWNRLPRTKVDESHIELHVEIIRAFESLFQQIQEHQGVPIRDRYPPLLIAALGEVIAAEPAEYTYSVSSNHGILEVSDEDGVSANHDSNEPMCAPPGAWPE